MHRRRWLARVAALLVVAAIAVGAWQIVELRHQVSALQGENDKQRGQLARQQIQISGLNAAMNVTAGEVTTAAALGRIQNQISAIEGQVSQYVGSTEGLSTKIDCVYQALSGATASLFDGRISPGTTC
jgi:hypothetical protein